MQVLRDLCCLARADGRADAKERELLCSIAAALGVGEFCVKRTLEELSVVELD